jgi:methionyl-tRNA synthetase
MIRRMQEAGDIYRGKYEGWYCESCNNYFTEKELEDELCPAHKTKPKLLSEENYFFRLSNYQERLERYISEHPEFIRPEVRRNEVLGILKEGLRDVSISRARSDWGTPFMPLDDKQVIYVWVDALINYISALGFGGEQDAKMKQFWPADLHIIGKDIIRFHCLIWPAMLWSAGLETPKQIFAHGFMTLEGKKMSKTQGNFVYAEDICKEFGVDAVKYFLLREYSFSADGDFNRQSLINRINSDLANDLGNLLNRSLNMMHKYFQGEIKDPGLPEGAPEKELREMALQVLPQVEAAVEKLEFNVALETIWGVVRRANKYVEEKAPWNLSKQGATDELQQAMYYLLEAMRFIVILITPFIPGAGEAMWGQLALKGKWSEANFAMLKDWGGTASPHTVGKAEVLFPRIEDKEKQ